MQALKKMLVITRDHMLVNTLRDGLTSDGYIIVNTAESGKDLRYTIYYEQPDFIIQDIGMPSLGGICTCLEVRQFCQTPIILLTTWKTEEGMMRGLDLNAENYLTEPFNIEILKLRMRETMKRNMLASARGPRQ